MSVTDELKIEKVREAGNNYYWMENTGGVECEVGEFIYGLVKMLKPNRALETGTYQGTASSYIAQAMKENGFGKLDTLEIESSHRELSRIRWEVRGLSNYIDSFLVSSLEFQPQGTYKFILIDTEPNIRFQEFEKYYPYLDSGGIIIIHDLHPHMSQIDVPNQFFGWPFGKLPDFIKNKILDHEIQCMHFETPRGLFVAQKQHPDFYSTKILNGNG